MTIASVHRPFAATGAVGPSVEIWAAFAGARDDRARLTGWLAVLMAHVPDAVLGVVLAVGHDDGVLRPLAILPDPRADVAQLRDIAAQALASGRPALTHDGADGDTLIACPVGSEGAPPTQVAALVLRGAASEAAQAALRELHWSTGWLVARAWQDVAAAARGEAGRAAAALDILALAGEHPRPEAASMAIVNALPGVVAADQVALGLLRGRRTAPRIRLAAVSHAAWFKRRSKFAETLETAMEECLDQSAPVAYPALPGLERAIALAHGEYVRQSRIRHLLSVPLADADGPIGVLSLERRTDPPFAEADRLMAEAIAALLGPVMELKRRNRRWFGGRLLDGTIHALGVLLGPRRLSWKLLGVALAVLAVLAATVRAPFRVQADAVLRGEIQRAVVAPFAGYIDRAPLRAGDRVAAGDVLARLEDTDLQLEALRWRSERDRLAAQQRDEMAQYNRAAVALLEAQIRQAEAQLELAEAKLDRTVLTAPIGGVIVQGDLSQRLGAPVQNGEVLFEIAPLDAYRVDIFVDERDLRHVAEGASGRLVLTGQPDAGLPLTVTRITPIATVREGANSFRVEARLERPPASVRPGMEGVAKIDDGDRLLAWIWTRRLVAWLRQTLWTWQP